VLTNLRPYPISRTLPLVEAISHDFNDQLLRVLGSQRLMYMDHAKFEDVMALAADLFAAWDENMKDFTNVARESESRMSNQVRECRTDAYSVPKTQREVHFDQDQPGARQATGEDHLP
jgi:hypothetical protein